MIKQVMKQTLVSNLIILTLLIGCSSEEVEEPTPEEAFEQFASYLAVADYESMYELLTVDAKQSITKETFVERYTNIHSGIQATSVQLALVQEDLEDEEETKEELVETYLPYELTLHTFLGDIFIDSQVRILLETEMNEEGKEYEKWAIDWTPDMILPYLTDEDVVRVRTFQPVRGQLFDRHGTGLAINGEVYSFGIVPERLPENELDILEKASDLLDISVAEIESALTQSWVKPELFVPIKSVSKDNQQLVDQLMDIEGNSVTYQMVNARVYPLKAAAAHLTGYIGEITAEELETRADEGYSSTSMVGKSGLELIFEETLRGEPGGKIFIVDADGNEKVTLIEKQSVQGPDIHLTIDATVQQSIHLQLEGEVGTGVAIHPISGEVLSLVSAPSYDPNDFILGMSTSQRIALNEHEGLPLWNRFSESFTPGSTLKPVIAAIALDTGWNADKKINIKGREWQKDSSWGNYFVRRVSDPGHSVDLKDAIVYSDNIYFAQLAIELGKEQVEAGLMNVGFGETLPFPYRMKVSQIANETINSDIDLANTSYGQAEVLVNPLHMALLYTPFVNNGSIPKPTLLMEEEKSLWKENLFDTSTTNEVVEALVDVIESPRGTANHAKISHLTLAGKTGTTEHKRSQGETGRETGWFVAVDTEDPSLLVLMMIESVENRGGSRYVVQKVKNVFEHEES